MKEGLIPASFVLAQLPAGDPWWTTLVNFGVAGIVIGWFMYRDKRQAEIEERNKNTDEARANRSHSEAIKMRLAIQLNTDSMMVAVAAMKQIDIGFVDLATRIKNQNDDLRHDENSDR